MHLRIGDFGGPPKRTSVESNPEQAGQDLFERSGHRETGISGKVVKIRLPGSISKATLVNRPSSAAAQRTTPTKSDVSASNNSSMNLAAWPLAANGISVTVPAAAPPVGELDSEIR